MRLSGFDGVHANIPLHVFIRARKEIYYRVHVLDGHTRKRAISPQFQVVLGSNAAVAVLQ